MKKGLLKVQVEVKGKNLIYLPETLRRKGVFAYNVKYIENSAVIITVDYNDLRKIFAICKNMCYNTKIKGYKGALSLFAVALKNIGITVGAILFIALTVLLDGIVFKVECVGTGAAVHSEILLCAENYGAKAGVLFKKVSLSGLETEILKSNKNLRYVTCYKKGNRLIIDSVLGDGSGNVNDKFESDLIAEVNGVIESVNVLRGTALVHAGDVIKSGDVLVGAYSIGKDGELYPSYVLASVSILVSEEYYFETQIFSDATLNASIEKAKFLTDGEVVFAKAEKTDGGYTVKLTARYIYYGG